MRQLYLCFFLLSSLLSSLLYSPQITAETRWEKVTFSEPNEVVEYFHSINYSLDNWLQGDRSVPRVYLTHVPANWRAHYAGEVSTAEKKRYFFFMVAPMVLRANETILQQRKFLLSMRGQAQWSAAQRQHIQQIAAEYDLAAPTAAEDVAGFKQLLRRVDEVPASLALAQAAIESGWGTSRFASQANALFGQWTWGDNAITPERVRTELGNYGIRSFATPFESISAYMHNLNTHRAYRQLRKLREEARKQGRLLSGKELAQGLEAYSERGPAYVKEVRSIIRVNRLSDVDKAFLRDEKPVQLEPLATDV